MDVPHIGANAFAMLKRQSQKDKNIQVFAVSLKDIEKALQPKVPTDPRTKLPQQYHQYLGAFDRREADKQPPLRGPEIDQKIELIKGPDGKEKEPPWGPLYSMSRDELLVLKHSWNCWKRILSGSANHPQRHRCNIKIWMLDYWKVYFIRRPESRHLFPSSNMSCFHFGRSL